MGFLTFDCVACKKTRYVSKKNTINPHQASKLSSAPVPAPVGSVTIAEESLCLRPRPQLKIFMKFILKGGDQRAKF